jgi:cytochrome b6-f complex subunit 7
VLSGDYPLGSLAITNSQQQSLIRATERTTVAIVFFMSITRFSMAGEILTTGFLAFSLILVGLGGGFLLLKLQGGE